MNRRYWYFGYGSLVNHRTRPGQEAGRRARVQGWQRVWSHRIFETPQRRASTSLNVQLDSEQAIDGILVEIGHEALRALDEREGGYDRILISSEAIALLDDQGHSIPDEPLPGEVFLYSSDERHCFRADEEHPILQSYADCVLDGYHTVFGAAGMQRMLVSTEGWSSPWFADRAAPAYPRAVPVSEESMRRIDAGLRPFRDNAFHISP